MKNNRIVYCPVAYAALCYIVSDNFHKFLNTCLLSVLASLSRVTSSIFMRGTNNLISLMQSIIEQTSGAGVKADNLNYTVSHSLLLA